LKTKRITQLRAVSNLIDKTKAIRLSYGNVFRLPRTSPDGPLHYGPYTIPSTTPVSMGHYSMHHNEALFPNSHSFVPERWLDNPKAPVLKSPLFSDSQLKEDQEKEDRGKPLSRYLVSFSRGARQCIGMNLAYAELYIGLATVFRRVQMRLYETGLEAVEAKIDIFVPRPIKGSKGVRVLVERVD
jgi:cytochrome P450